MSIVHTVLKRSVYALVESVVSWNPNSIFYFPGPAFSSPSNSSHFPVLHFQRSRRPDVAHRLRVYCDGHHCNGETDDGACATQLLSRDVRRRLTGGHTTCISDDRVDTRTAANDITHRWILLDASLILHHITELNSQPCTPCPTWTTNSLLQHCQI